MGFLQRPQTKSQNPTSKFLEWKSEEKCFSYYDKELRHNVKVELPLKFIVLEEYHTIKGFSDSDNTGIYSNEVLSIGTQEMTVKTFKGRVIASGLYKNIKTTVNPQGGVYHKSIYGVTPDGELINIAIKGSAVQAYGDFTAKGAYKRLRDEWVTIAEAQDLKKGRVSYSVPVFKFDVSLSDKEFELVSQTAEKFSAYIEDYLSPKVSQESPDESTEGDNDIFDDDPFV